ncbi:MAG: hypothetical protein Q8R29_03065 [bacterium]|nr:hypothetical protein [bacterium]
MADGQNKDLVLAPGEFAYVLDTTKGVVSTIVGSNNTSLSANQYPVLWDSDKRQFVRCDELNRARQSFVNVPEGSYVVLESPADSRSSHPQEGANNTTTPDLQFGRRVNIPGPAHFSLWPRQTARVVQGHQLRSNQFLTARVYNDEQAAANWDAAVVRPQALGEGDGQKNRAAIPKPDHLTMGQLLIIKGTDVSFYIPPTGVEVLSQEEGAGSYVRDAVTLERLEYCILLDESGNKRFVPGPDVVFPKPTETFVEMGGKVKFRAIELNEISGIHVKVIADYVDNKDGSVHNTGEELFITGRDQAIYFPRPEHSIVSYGDQQIYFAVAVPAGEGRYVLDRLTGNIKLVKGPMMLLPDPRREVIVRRVLDQRIVGLLYPGNQRALEVNKQLQEISQQLPVGEHFTQRAVEQYAVRSLTATSENIASESFQRKAKFTPPRTITLDTKYDGAVMVNVWAGYAVLVTDSVGQRRVVIGPETILLEYNESLMSMELSTGTPKSDDKTVQTAYLRVHNNRVSDKVTAETSDLCQVSLTLSYRVNFEGNEPERWFEVENYVKFLTDHLRSLIRNTARQHGVENFYKDAINIVRDAVLGVQQSGGRTGRLFSENGMRVYDVEVLDVKIDNAEIAKLLTQTQHKTVEATLKVVEAERNLENTKRIEKAKQGSLEECAGTTKLERHLETQAVRQALDVNLAKIQAQGQEVLRRNKLKLAERTVLKEISTAELAIEKAQEDQKLALAKIEIEQELHRLSVETQEFVKRTEAVSQDMIAAMQAFGDKHLIEKISQAMAPLAILGGGSVVDVLKQLIDGTPLQKVLGGLGESDGRTRSADRVPVTR